MHICDHTIVEFGIRENCIGLSNTSHVDSLDIFRRSVVGKVKSDICILQKGYDSKGNNMKVQYANNYVQKLGIGDPITCVYKIIYKEKDINDTQITPYLLCMVWDYVSR